MNNELTPEERELRAKENLRLTEEANRLAMEARMRDQVNGARPVLSEVADSIKKQLEEKFPANNEGYEEGGATGETNPETNS